MLQYHDQLCKDMGVPRKRTEVNSDSESISTYNVHDYEEFFKKEELRQPEFNYTNPNHVP